MPSPFPSGTGYGANSPVPRPQGPYPASPPSIPGFPANDPAPPWTRPGGPGWRGIAKRIGRFGWGGVGFALGWEIGVRIFGDPFERLEGYQSPSVAQLDAYNVCAGPQACPGWYGQSNVYYRYEYVNGSGACSPISCTPGGAGAMPGPNAPWSVSGTPNSIWLFSYRIPTNGGASQRIIEQTWNRVLGSPAPAYRPGLPHVGLVGDPFPLPRPYPQPGTSPAPNVDPFVVPPNAPGPLPAPRPFTSPQPEPGPGRDPAYEPEVTPRPRPRRVIRPFRPAPGVVIHPPGRPGDGPTVEVHPPTVPTPPTGGGAPVNPAPGPGRPGVSTGPWGDRPRHKFDPPTKRERERKVQGQGALRFAQALMHVVTEGGDAIDALWHALEGNGGWQTKIRGQRTPYDRKLADIYVSVDRPGFDLPRFIATATRNLVANELIDHAGGRLGRINRRASRAARPHGDLPFGFQFGPGL